MSKESNKVGICAICETEQRLTRHHILPKSKARGVRRKPDGKYCGIARICRPCHDLVHERFTNVTLFCLSWEVILKVIRGILKARERQRQFEENHSRRHQFHAD